MALVKPSIYTLDFTRPAPRNEVSGGKVLKKKTRKVVSRLATALRMVGLSPAVRHESRHSWLSGPKSAGQYVLGLAESQ